MREKDRLVALLNEWAAEHESLDGDNTISAGTYRRYGEIKGAETFEAKALRHRETAIALRERAEMIDY